MRHHRVARISGQRVRDERILGITAGFVFGAIAAFALLEVFSQGPAPAPQVAMTVREQPAPPAPSQAADATVKAQAVAPRAPATPPVIVVADAADRSGPTGHSLSRTAPAAEAPGPLATIDPVALPRPALPAPAAVAPAQPTAAPAAIPVPQPAPAEQQLVAISGAPASESIPLGRLAPRDPPAPPPEPFSVRVAPSTQAAPTAVSTTAQAVAPRPVTAPASGPAPLPAPVSRTITAPAANTGTAMATVPAAATRATTASYGMAATEARVFVHYSRFRESERQRAVRLAQHLRAQGVNVVDIRGVDFGIRAPSVRYFFGEDREDGEMLVHALRRFYADEGGLGRPPERAQSFASYSPKPNSGTIEVWLPSD